MKLLVLITLHSIKTQFNIYCYQFITYKYTKQNPVKIGPKPASAPIVRFENSPPHFELLKSRHPISPGLSKETKHPALKNNIQRP